MVATRQRVTARTRGGAPATLDERALAEHRARARAGRAALPFTSTETTPSSSRKTSLPSSPSVTSVAPWATVADARLGAAAHDAAGQLALQRGLHLADQRGRVLVAPWRVRAEGARVPVLEVDKARLQDQPAVVVVDPVAREGAGADDLVLGAAVGVQGQRQRRPRQRRRHLDERRVLDPARRRHAGASAAGLHEAHRVVRRPPGPAGGRGRRPRRRWPPCRPGASWWRRSGRRRCSRAR